uniref:Uncharacterized protein n=1 Tax=Arundo donax TaxID=35708 RepID=A0A0A9CIK8_ARUDO
MIWWERAHYLDSGRVAASKSSMRQRGRTGGLGIVRCARGKGISRAVLSFSRVVLCVSWVSWAND